MPSKKYELKFGIGGNNKKDKMRKTRGNMSPEALYISTEYGKFRFFTRQTNIVEFVEIGGK
jgi:hypothetical protein